ncbi:hypothetical protein [Metakosakonia massiliensis]|uniref:hypothetical protein n=1 Tax=Phytobacter massiliensis TaxID=1485952 RepID=UPI0005C4BFB8|nr:hypothetical protein [Phytobacter massiliensis]
MGDSGGSENAEFIIANSTLATSLTFDVPLSLFVYENKDEFLRGVFFEQTAVTPGFYEESALSITQHETTF